MICPCNNNGKNDVTCNYNDADDDQGKGDDEHYTDDDHYK
jgi:hypothetical protein